MSPRAASPPPPCAGGAAPLESRTAGRPPAGRGSTRGLAERLDLDLDVLDVALHLHVVAGLDLGLREAPGSWPGTRVGLGLHQLRQRLGGRAQVRQAAALRLLDPLRRVVVALEADGLGRRRPPRVTTSSTASARLLPLAMRASRAAANSPSASATAAFRKATGIEIEAAEDTARNSNLLPVNANGEVRLRSVLSRATSGSLRMPRLIVSRPLVSRSPRPSRCRRARASAARRGTPR